jgi:aldehyde:ferredoxin oxidoreductase
MFGFYGRILTVNVTDESIKIETLTKEICEQALGGKGLATHLLLNKNSPGVEPFSEENHLIFATGAVCQSALWSTSRFGVFTKSPLTGFYSESYSGARTPEAMDAAWFDAVVIRGKAKKPTALSVHQKGMNLTMPAICGVRILITRKMKQKKVFRWQSPDFERGVPWSSALQEKSSFVLQSLKTTTGAQPAESVSARSWAQGL